MSTPTPRTDAAWASSFEPCEYRAAHTARIMRECSQQLETELATLRAQRDQLRAEVKSCGELSCDECNARTAALTAERDQLRAERDSIKQEIEMVEHRAYRADAELAAEQARLDWVFRNCKVTADDYPVHDREDLGVAMKGDEK